MLYESWAKFVTPKFPKGFSKDCLTWRSNKKVVETVSEDIFFKFRIGINSIMWLGAKSDWTVEDSPSLHWQEFTPNPVLNRDSYGYQARFKTISERGLFLEGGLPYICPEFQNYEMALLGMLFLSYIFTKLRDQKQVLPTLCQKVIRPHKTSSYIDSGIKGGKQDIWGYVINMRESKKRRSALKSSFIGAGKEWANRAFWGKTVMCMINEHYWWIPRKQGPRWDPVLNRDSYAKFSIFSPKHFRMFLNTILCFKLYGEHTFM